MRSAQRTLRLYAPHSGQQLIHESIARFRAAPCGRRWGKTYCGTNELARYAWEHGIKTSEYPSWWIAPTYKQARKPFDTISMKLRPAVKEFHLSPYPRIVWVNGHITDFLSAQNPNNLRGEGVGLMIIDECAFIAEQVWTHVLRPMLTDTGGSALFLGTPRGSNWFRDMYERGQSELWSDYESWCFPTSSNPRIPASEIEEARRSLTADAFMQEYMAAFLEDAVGALWTKKLIEQNRVERAPSDLVAIAIGIDPAVTANENSDETGIIACGLGRDGHGYVLGDASGIYAPVQWAHAAGGLFESLGADRIVAEVNNGGDLVKANLIASGVNHRYKDVHASRGKSIRAEPIVAFYQRGMVHHVGRFPELETQMTTWCPWDKNEEKGSPDRMDALVWALTDLMVKKPVRRREAEAVAR